MEAEMMALASAGATALAQQMVVESWTQARDRMVSFFTRRGAGGEDVLEGELETSREELIAAVEAGDEQTAVGVQEAWRARLRHTLLTHPDAASELREILDGLDVRGSRQVDVHNTISGGVQHSPVIQTGSVGSLTFGTPFDQT